VPVITADVDRRAATLTVHAQLATYLDRAWQLWSDPRLLEQWWGPLGSAAPVLEHDLTPGGRVVASHRDQDGPEGEHRAEWRVATVEVPERLELHDSAQRIVVRSQPVQEGVAMSVAVTYADEPSLETALSGGAKDRLVEALARVDALL
jgi:uncharacterized protein YndB with AHSA1/START domain